MNMKRAFTFLELIVAVAILGTLASFVILQTAGSRKTAFDNRRKSDLLNIQSALELHYAANKNYPATFAPNPGAAPGFIVITTTNLPTLSGFLSSSLPQDPVYNSTNQSCGTLASSTYYYGSDGSQYKVLAHCPINSNIDKAASTDSFLDQLRQSGQDKSWSVCRGADACAKW